MSEKVNDSMKYLLLLPLTMLFLLAACGSDDAAPEPTATPSDEPQVVHNVESLRDAAAELDGEVVTVRSTYWSNSEQQYLSDILMESYPPQIPTDMAIILEGDVPEAVLDMLTSADDVSPTVIWGEVDITGEVRVDGDDVYLEIHEAYAVQA